MSQRCVSKRKPTSGQKKYAQRFKFTDVLIKGAYTATERALAGKGVLNPSRHFDTATNVRLKEGNGRERAVVGHRIFNQQELDKMTKIISRAQEGISQERALELKDKTRGARLAVGGGHM
jgi:hypothetical protein